jgi:hypothetical protein
MYSTWKDSWPVVTTVNILVATIICNFSLDYEVLYKITMSLMF